MAAVTAMAFLVMLAMMTGMVVAIVVFLVAAWRTMRAHETVADAMREAVEDIESKGVA